MSKFWSDDFDMDMLRVYPKTIQALGATAEIKLWTLSHESYGRINCPVAWNTYSGLRSFLWLENPYLDFARDKNGWINIDGFVCNERVMECTWLEWLRDMWAHQQSWLLIPSGNIASVERGGVSFAAMDWGSFQTIMWDIRKWNDGLPEKDRVIRAENAKHGYASGWIWLLKANRRFARAVHLASLGREDFPYFAPGSVPVFNRPTAALDAPQDGAK